MCDSNHLPRCSSYEADVDFSDTDSEISNSSFCSSYSESEEEIDDNAVVVPPGDGESKKLEKKKSIVLLEGYIVDTAAKSDGDREDLKRTKSLTDDDLEELKGCVDLGFGFNYEEIPELCNTLPALELCYSMSHHHHSSSPPLLENKSSVVESPIANWKISSPGDNPDDVKARLKFWAQAVACTVRLCT